MHMREVFRQIAIVFLSSVITLALWLLFRLILERSEVALSTPLTYVVVLLIYMLIRQGTEIAFVKLGWKSEMKHNPK